MVAPSHSVFPCYADRVKLPTYAERTGLPAHVSLARRALGADAHEYLIDQANLRGYVGAWTARDHGTLDASLGLEEIVVGLLHPEAPIEARVLKLLVRMLQSGDLDLPRLHLVARRERALAHLAWLVALIPPPERSEPVCTLEALIAARPPRQDVRPTYEYAPDRLLGRRSRVALRPDRL